MNKLKIAILGVGKIGEFHVREFNNAGCEVVAILTNSEESSGEKAMYLKEKYGINARPYFTLESLLENEQLDIVSVCTPSKFHAEQVRECLNKGLHVMCEKPFVFDSLYSNYNVAKELFDLARENCKILCVDTQFVSLLKSIPSVVLENVRNFSIYMEPAPDKAINLMVDAIPHMNSFLIRILGYHDIRDLAFKTNNEINIQINFTYGNCQAEYVIGSKKDRPRKLSFNVNGVEFERKILPNYRQQLVYSGNSLDVEDPLKVSISKFVDVCRGSGKPLVDEKEILHNVELQDKIIRGYEA